MSRSWLALFTLGYSAVNASALLLLRHSMSRSEQAGTSLAGVLRNPPPGLIAGLALYVLSFAAFVVSTRYFPVTVIFPLLAGGAYAAVVLGGWLVLGETLSAIQVVGVLLVGSGIVLLQVR